MTFLIALCAGLLVQDPADEKAMMEAWIKASQPNENHKVVEQMAGSWTTLSKMAQGDGKPDHESKGTADGKMMFGGRFLQFGQKGDFGGQPFEGFGLFGYDNTKKKFTGVWTDSMSTALLPAEGDYDKAKKTLTLYGEYLDPISGTVKKGFRWVYTFKSDKEFTFEMWEVPPFGVSLLKEPVKEHKGLTIVYTKK